MLPSNGDDVVDLAALGFERMYRDEAVHTLIKLLFKNAAAQEIFITQL